MHTREGIIKCIGITLEELNIEFSKIKLQYSVENGFSLQKTIEYITDNTIKNNNIIISKYREIYNSGIGAKYSSINSKIIDFIHSKYYGNDIIIIASNKGVKAIKDGISINNIEYLFSGIYGDDGSGVLKPDFEFFRKITRDFNCSVYKEGVVIGDTITDQEFAVNIGYQFYYASSGYGALEKFSKIPDYII